MSDADPKLPSRDRAAKSPAKKLGSEDQAWQDDQTRKAIEEADAGDFATAEELKGMIRKFVPHG